MSNPYPIEELDPNEDDGTMPANVAELADAVIGRRIVSAERGQRPGRYGGSETAFVLTLDDGRRVTMRDTDDCCAATTLESFLLNPEAVDHMILGVGTTGGYTTWHIYADFGDVMQLKVGWSCGNPFYYGYGFDISVEETLESRLAAAEEKAATAEAARRVAVTAHRRLSDMLLALGKEIDLYMHTEAPQAQDLVLKVRTSQP